jgi:hypothetical protein
MRASLALLCPKTVTYVLNLLCYLCSEPAPRLAVKTGTGTGAGTIVNVLLLITDIQPTPYSLQLTAYSLPATPTASLG